jgi:glycosyltransferase involved in cell wall biosynthesis
MQFSKLTIIMPAYNEEKTIQSILKRIADIRLVNQITKEIIVIDDCSKDNTANEVRSFMENNPGMDIVLHSHTKNQGKGAAIHTGIAKATGDFVIVQDADLEYDPEEYNSLIVPIIKGGADVVYGSRFMGGNPHRILFYWHSIGNKFLTKLSNMFTNTNLTDMETCYKMIRRDIIQNIKLYEKRFGFESEVTTKLSRIKGIRIYEVGISYYGRTYKEGKKINWKDGFRAIYCIIKYNLFSK